jgi:hypothetical protein
MTKRPSVGTVEIKFVMPEVGDIEVRVDRILEYYDVRAAAGMKATPSPIRPATDEEWASTDAVSFLDYVSQSRRCGLNADWASMAWWFPVRNSRRSNTTSGDVYILDDELPEELFSAVRRWYADDKLSDDGDNDTIEVIGTGSALDMALLALKTVKHDGYVLELARLVHRNIGADVKWALTKEDMAHAILDCQRLETELSEWYYDSDDYAERSGALAKFREWPYERKVYFITKLVIE